MSEEMFNGLPDEVAKSWKAHTDAFGPVLNPAFEDDVPTRIQLTAALNHISNKNTARGLDILCEIKERCICDADRCAVLFCMALAYEISGNQEMMISCYYQCCHFSPDFYLPYIKVAKSAHTNQNFDVAKEFYKKTLQQISAQNSEQNAQMRMLEASVTSNLASCYTMMHDYRMAMLMLDYSSGTGVYPPGRNGAYAMLYAAMDDAEKATEYLSELKNENKAMFDYMKNTVYEILNGVHPHFRVIEPNTEQTSVFWACFEEKEKLFREQLDSGTDNYICDFISEKMTQAFPFMQKKLRVRAEKGDSGYRVELTDYYSLSLTCGYNDLISDMPGKLKADWDFIIVHD